MISVALLLLASTPDLGEAAGRCRQGEDGSSVIVHVMGLKDRQGRLKLELYPANDRDFLADDNVLISAGKAFARVEANVPATGTVELCIRAPSAGTFALSLLHDRNADRKFTFSTDGIGFAGNPRLGLSRPSAASASVRVGNGPTHIWIVMNYRGELFSFRPIEAGL